MAELKPGDFVEYCHTKNGDPERNGAVGVVTRVEGTDTWVNWVSSPVYILPTIRPHTYNLRKLGELEVSDV